MPARSRITRARAGLLGANGGVNVKPRRPAIALRQAPEIRRSALRQCRRGRAGPAVKGSARGGRRGPAARARRYADEIDDPPRDRRGRVDPGTGQGASRSSMRAAAGNACRRARPCRCAGRPASTKQGAISAAIAGVARPARRAARPPRCRRAALSRPGSRRSPGRNRGSAPCVYSRFTVAWVPSTETRLLFEPAQAGLIAGTVPTNGTR